MGGSILLLLGLSLLPNIASESGPGDVEALLETIEALQQPLQDFRCEYEGRIYFKSASARKEWGLDEEGLYDSFSGVFIWTAEGDTFSDSLHRIAPEGEIERRTLAVRMWERQAEEYQRKTDAMLGAARVEDPESVTSFEQGNYGKIFLIDELKRKATGESFVASVSDGERDGRPCKVVSVGLRGFPDRLWFRFWVDLNRSGQVVRQEAYGVGGALAGYIDVTLKSYPVGDEEVWMPVSGEARSFASRRDGKPFYSESPEIIETMYVVGGTMEFNRHPGREVFTIKYEPGTPISDGRRKMQYEFGQQRAPDKPTRADAEASLREQLAEAEAQKSRLVVASPRPGFPWLTGLTWGFGVLALVSVVLWILRRPR